VNDSETVNYTRWRPRIPHEFRSRHPTKTPSRRSQQGRQFPLESRRSETENFAWHRLPGSPCSPRPILSTRPAARQLFLVCCQASRRTPTRRSVLTTHARRDSRDIRRAPLAGAGVEEELSPATSRAGATRFVFPCDSAQAPDVLLAEQRRPPVHGAAY
jgi:hypothetical protein